MTWVEGAVVLFGGLVALMGLGLPVAFAFLALNVRRRMAVPRRRTGTVAAGAQRRAVDHQFFADADPVLRADGRGAVPHRRGAQGDRRVRGADPPGAGPTCGDRDRRRHGVFGDLGLDHRHHRAARQPDAADHAGARLRPAHRDGTDHGHRRRRHADPAVGAHRAARQPRRHLDFRAADRRHCAGADAERDVRRLHRAARDPQSRAGAGRDDGGRPDRGGALGAVPHPRAAAGHDLRPGGRRHDRAAGRRRRKPRRSARPAPSRRPPPTGS